jgi:hypothetical protein
MEVPGFDTYSLPERPSILYCIREFRTKFKELRIKTTLELIVRPNCPFVKLSRGAAKNPHFLIQNTIEGMAKPIGSSIDQEIRKAIFYNLAGDVFEGCTDAVSDISSVFTSVPFPKSDVLARIPIIVARELEYDSGIEPVKKVDSAVFELKPQSFGYMVVTERGMANFLKALDKKIKVFSS